MICICINLLAMVYVLQRRGNNIQLVSAASNFLDSPDFHLDSLIRSQMKQVLNGFDIQVKLSSPDAVH